ncbi:TPA: SprT-like domain-containing protein [Escherichia coli]|nr:SprT-like domain-containing protein [Escherichia coli]
METENKIKEKIKPTIIAYNEFQQAYDFFNEKLFYNELPDILITFQRGQKYLGYFSGDRFGGKTITSELAMNPDFFATRSVADVLSTLVHEMCHVWQHYANVDKSKGNNYHDKIWGKKMEEVGLTPSHNGLPDGKKTGKKMSHYITPGGAFQEVLPELIQRGIGISWFDQFGFRANSKNLMPMDKKIVDGWKEKIEDEKLIGKLTEIMGQSEETLLLDFEQLSVIVEEKKKRNKTRVTFICPGCKLKMLGKPTAYVICGECDEVLVEEQKEEDE